MQKAKYTRLSAPVLMIVYMLFSGCSSKKESGQTISLETVKLSKLNGEKVDMTKFEGKTVFLNFWATWCGPCIQEMPSIEKAQHQLNNEDIVFLLASNEDVEQIERFSRKHDFKLQYVKLENMEELNVPVLPTTFIFDSGGTLRFSESGYRMWSEPVNLDIITKIANDEK